MQNHSMDSNMGKEQNHEGDFTNHQWVEIHDYQSPQQHHSPMHEYSNFGYIPSPHIPLEPAYNRSMPSSYHTHPPLQPLITAQWPSMLTNPSNSAPPMIHSAPPLAPVPTISPAASLPPITNPPPAPTSRRTLTDNDRRRMCQYHEDNPTVKQTEIGAMFGVERSTVSKVLRQKDKYLFPDDGNRSPIKRSKGKFPDIERALSNWARNHQRQGFPLSDLIIREKARFFANTVGSSESHIKVNSASWLEKFKQKNYLLGAKPRKASDANDSDCVDSKSESPSRISPDSPLSPMSQDNLKTESPDFIDFTTSYRHAHSQSATSLASSFPDGAAPSSSFSGGPQSPTSPFFSPDANCVPNPFMPSQHPRLTSLPSANAARPRSQTFPMIGVEPAFMTTSASSENGEPLTPRCLQQQSMDTPTLQTPIEELPEPILVVSPSSIHRQQHTVTSPPLRHNQNSSPLSMAPPPQPPTLNTSSPILTSSSSSTTISPASNPTNSTLSTPVSASTASPSQDEARRALELVIQFFHHQPTGFVDPQEYYTMGKLMEKLKVHGGGGRAEAMSGLGMQFAGHEELPGGMHRVDMEVEIQVQKKRSIHSL